MRLSHIVEHVYFRPWAISPQGWETVHRLVQSKLAGDVERLVMAQRPATEDDDGGDLFGARQDIEKRGRVAVIPIAGVIGKRIGLIGRMCGGADTEDIEANLKSAAADPGVDLIMLDIDSPGGSVTGVPELASVVRWIDGVKPVYAHTETMAASAAYWLASQTRGIFATQTAYVGSVGVYCALLDESRAYALQGYEVEVIKAGKFKGEGVPGTSISDEFRAALQREVNQVYEWFVADVRRGRPAVAQDDMQGQAYYAGDAAQRGMIDAVVGSIDGAIARATKQENKGQEK